MKIITRINEIGFSITEFSEYLHVSRPSLYKYCEEFDKKSTSRIPEKVLRILKVIKLNKLIGKNYIIKLIIELSCLDFEQKETSIYNTFNNLGYSFSDQEKKFIWKYINDNEFRKEIKEKLNEK